MKVHLTGKSNMKRNQMMIVFIPTFVYLTADDETGISLVWIFFELEFNWKTKTKNHV